MARANLPIETSEYIDILDEEFNRYLEVAKILIKTLKKPKDKTICAKYVKKCTELTALNIEVKNNRNKFFKYFLKMLQTASAKQPPQYDSWFKPKTVKTDGEKATSYWTPDKKTYIAAKAIPGYGTLVYMAVSYDPQAGWQPSGFSSCEF